MKVIFSGSDYCNIHFGGVWMRLYLEKNLDKPLSNYMTLGHADESHTFKFSTGPYDYAGWLDAVSQMAIDAEQIHVTNVDDDVLCISTVGADGRHEARLLKSGECYVDDEIYGAGEK